MKRTTLWKIASMVLLVAVTLPLFSALAPTPVSAVAVIPPLPYAMERYGQHHSGIYSTAKEIVLDGVPEDTYCLMDSFDDQAGNFDGIFVSETADGSVPNTPATEFVPDMMEIAGTYDRTYLYLCVRAITRTTDMGYALDAGFGFNFGMTQKEAQESKKTLKMEIASDAAEKTEADHYIKTATLEKEVTDSSGTYSVNDTVFEFRVAWADIAPDGKLAEVDFDRLYLSLVLRYSDSEQPMYWVYGVPNNVVLPSEITVKDAFEAHFGENGVGTFTPNVVELLGARGTYTQIPEIAEVERTDKNTNNARSFEVTGSVSDVTRESITEAGVLFMEKTSDLGAKSLTLNTAGAQILTGGELVGESKLNYTVSFSTKEESYNTYFTLRPYIKYEDGSVVYGKTYSNTPSYFDAENVGYKERINLLMIGNSFCSYYLDELVQIAKADNIYLLVARSYKSGASAYENWTWLVNDFKSDEEGVLTRKVCSPDIPNTQNRGNFTLKEILAYADWDVITTQGASSGVEISEMPIEPGITEEQKYDLGLSHMKKTFRYLEVNYPNAKLYAHQTWAVQLGYGYAKGTVVVEDGKIVSGTPNASIAEEKRMTSYEQQTQQYETIAGGYRRFSKVTGIPLVPSGDAWQIARANPLIGDTLCNKGAATDYYHEGEEGGGQYLNACVFYEVITGNDVRGNTWRPTGYEISEEKIEVLQNAAHEAVLAIYGPDHYSK